MPELSVVMLRSFTLSIPNAFCCQNNKLFLNL
uniref:Uncharacterized protein n=1 Tax=virus sp. ctBM815 TaxID=2825806 RepID=A0A8S5RK80_9VIRU|nr:MAG TPA: hypothetical protein [virus sp. ctBM815]